MEAEGAGEGVEEVAAVIGLDGCRGGGCRVVCVYGSVLLAWCLLVGHSVEVELKRKHTRSEFATLWILG